MISPAPLAAQAERRWIVDNAAVASGDGSPATPFITLAEAVNAAGEGDVIAVSATINPYRGGIALKSGQTLIGEGGTPLITASEGNAITVTGATTAVRISNLRIRTTGAVGLQASRVAKLIVEKTSIESIDAPAMSIENTELDASFESVSARGDRLTNAISLQNTTGRINIDGGTIDSASMRAISAISATNVTLRNMKLLRSAKTNGVAASECGGDLIAGSNERCNAAVLLKNVDGATLEGITIEGSGQVGVAAHDVRKLAIVDSAIRNAGDELYEHGVVLEELGGECRITGTTIEHSASRQLMLHNSRGQLALVIERSKFSETGKPHGQQGVLVTAVGDAAIDLRVSDTSFARAFGNALEVNATDHTKVAVRVTGSRFDRNASAISLAATQSATLDYVIADNPVVTNSENAALNIYLGTPSTGTLSGTISRNVIGASGVTGSGAACSSCSGIVLSANGRGTLIADVSGNIVQQVGASAIHATASQGGAQMQLTAIANLLRQGSASAPAIRVQSGALADDTTQVCADLGGSGVKANTIEGTWDANGAIHLMHRFGGTRFQLAGLVDGKSDEAAATAVAARNGGVKVRAVLRPDSMERGFAPAQRCTMPALTP